MRRPHEKGVLVSFKDLLKRILPPPVHAFNREVARFAVKWPEILKNGDPYYNPNLTLDSQDFSLKRI